MNIAVLINKAEDRIITSYDVTHLNLNNNQLDKLEIRKAVIELAIRDGHIDQTNAASYLVII